MYYSYFSYWLHFGFLSLFSFCLIFLTYSEYNLSCYIECFFVNHSIYFLEQSELSFNILKLITAQIREGLYRSHFECCRICTHIWLALLVHNASWTASHLWWLAQTPRGWSESNRRPLAKEHHCETLPKASECLANHVNYLSNIFNPRPGTLTWVKLTAASYNCHFCSPNRGLRALSL